jgi:hypothetical protein
MPEFYAASKYKSFQRNLNLWGFETISKGHEKGVCSHPFFVRGQPLLCRRMTRVVVKGNGTRRKEPSKKDANTEGGAGWSNNEGSRPSPLEVLLNSRDLLAGAGNTTSPMFGLRSSNTNFLSASAATGNTLLSARGVVQQEATSTSRNAMIQEIMRHQQTMIMLDRIRKEQALKEQALLDAIAAIEIAAARQRLT